MAYPATHGMRGLLGSSAGSRDSKKRFVARAARQRSCEYLAPRGGHHGHTPAGHVVTLSEFHRGSHFDHPGTSQCLLHSALQVLPGDADPTPGRMAGPPDLAYLCKATLRPCHANRGTSRASAQAVCDQMGCAQEELRDADIRLPALREHRHDRNTNARALFVHPNKCASS